MERSNRPVVVIVGPTGSGKTALSLSIAKEFSGEIICADSRTVYRGFDIGTAKPTQAEQAQVPHHLLDVIDAGEIFTAADFKRQAKNAINDIRYRGNLPIVVGGTGLYIDSLIFDYKFAPKPDQSYRDHLNTYEIEDLQKYCIDHNIKLPQNHSNKRYLIRAIEQKGVNQRRENQVLREFKVVGIATDKHILRQRLESRAEAIFQEDVVTEASKLANTYGWSSEAMTGNIYPLLRRVLAGDITVAEAKQRFITLDWRLAKRQLTWFKRNPSIVWLPYEEARRYIRGLIGDLDRHEQ